MASTAVLYLTYDGLMEPLGQSQIMPYLIRLSATRAITVVSFEKPEDMAHTERLSRFTSSLRDAGIRWVPLRYHRTPRVLSTAWDLLIGFAACVWICAVSSIRIVHARSFVAAVLAWPLKRMFNIAFIFDTRGFWVDGRIANGSMREGSILLAIARWFEFRCLHDADVIFVLSQAALDLLRDHPAVRGRRVRLEVVTTCTDLSRFHPAGDRISVSKNSCTLGYVGNAGLGYLFEPVVDLFLAIRTIRPDAVLKIVNRLDHAAIRQVLEEKGVDAASFRLLSCDYPEVPQQMWEMDLGLLPVFHPRLGNGRLKTDPNVAEGPAAAGNVPTRLGEYLACGVPCIATGHSDGGIEILEEEEIGLVLRGRDAASMAQAAAAAVSLISAPNVRERCVSVARRHFSLDTGVAVYEAVYRDLVSPSAAPIRI